MLSIEKIGLKYGVSLHIQMLTDNEFKFSVNEGAPLLFNIAEHNKILFDIGLFKKQIIIFKENMIKWRAKKIDKEGIPVENVKGVGQKAQALREAGIKTAEKLAKTSIDDLVKIKGIGATTASKLIENAKTLLKS